MITLESVTEFMGKNVEGILISSLSMFMHTLYDYINGKKIEFTKTVIKLILAGWVGYILSDFGIPSGFIAIGGWGTMKILDIIEKEGAKFLVDKVLNK